jgi:hypothetical protein
MGSADAALRLAFNQPSAAMNLFCQSQRFPGVLSPREFQTAMNQCLADVEEMARSWGTIPLRCQAKAANAWAEKEQNRRIRRNNQKNVGKSIS